MKSSDGDIAEELLSNTPTVTICTLPSVVVDSCVTMVNESLTELVGVVGRQVKHSYKVMHGSVCC